MDWVWDGVWFRLVGFGYLSILGGLAVGECNDNTLILSEALFFIPDLNVVFYL
jgi:hypothetical protein